jgi:hypothetical protein
MAFSYFPGGGAPGANSVVIIHLEGDFDHEGVPYRDAYVLWLPQDATITEKPLGPYRLPGWEHAVISLVPEVVPQSGPPTLGPAGYPDPASEVWEWAGFDANPEISPGSGDEVEFKVHRSDPVGMKGLVLLLSSLPIPW